MTYVCFILAEKLGHDVRDVMEWPIDLIRDWLAYYEARNRRDTEARN